MDNGITRLYQRYPCGKSITWDIHPTGGIRETVENSITKNDKKHERDCNVCGPPPAMII